MMMTVRPTPPNTTPPTRPTSGPVPRHLHSGQGFGRVLVAIYAVLALGASARGIVQLVTKGAEAPLAYALSLAAGIIYIVATVALARDGVWRTVAWSACGVEAFGVITVGIASIADPVAFPDATVWSGFGAGYGYVPLILPFVGLAWLRHTGRTSSTTQID